MLSLRVRNGEMMGCWKFNRGRSVRIAAAEMLRNGVVRLEGAKILNTAPDIDVAGSPKTESDVGFSLFDLDSQGVRIGVEAADDVVVLLSDVNARGLEPIGDPTLDGSVLDYVEAIHHERAVQALADSFPAIRKVFNAPAVSDLGRLYLMEWLTRRMQEFFRNRLTVIRSLDLLTETFEGIGMLG